MARGNNKITEFFGNIISLPARMKASEARRKADRDQQAIKDARQTKGVKADPSTKAGRGIITSRNIAQAARQRRDRKNK